jgi:phage-related minor tail protein
MNVKTLHVVASILVVGAVAAAAAAAQWPAAALGFHALAALLLGAGHFAGTYVAPSALSPKTATAILAEGAVKAALPGVLSAVVEDLNADPAKGTSVQDPFAPSDPSSKK